LVIITLILLGTFYGLSHQLSVYAVSSADDWPMYHNDAAHTGYSNGTAPTTLPVQLWNYTFENDPLSTPHSPVVVDGFVYVNSAEYSLSCFDASTGANIWNFPVVSYAYSAPAVVNGRVYVGSVNGVFYCLDASRGSQVWNYSTGDSFDSSPTVINDLVYVESPNGDTYCLDATSGNRVWNFSIGSTASGSSPAVSGDYVYMGNEGGGVFCLDASNGGVVWNVTVGGAVGSPAFSNGYVYLGSTDGNVYCLNASDGTKVWNYTTEYNSNGPSHNYHWGNAVSDPAVAYGKVYVGSSDFLVYCLDASSGNQIWNYTTEAGVYSSPAVAGGCVLAGSYDGNVYCLNATSGSEIWSYPAGVFSPVNAGGSAGSPAVAGGVIYVVGNGVVYALAAPSTSPSFPLIAIALAVVVAAVVAVAVVYVTFAKRKGTAAAEPASALSPSP
jgi:eukaryotic-like serine/threonine-protein kinase